VTNERRIAELERENAALKQTVAVQDEKIDSLRREVDGLRDDGKAIRGWLIGFCISLAIAAVGMAVTLSQIAQGGN